MSKRDEYLAGARAGIPVLLGFTRWASPTRLWRGRQVLTSLRPALVHRRFCRRKPDDGCRHVCAGSSVCFVSGDLKNHLSNARALLKKGKSSHPKNTASIGSVTTHKSVEINTPCAAISGLASCSSAKITVFILLFIAY